MVNDLNDFLRDWHLDAVSLSKLIDRLAALECLARLATHVDGLLHAQPATEILAEGAVARER